MSLKGSERSATKLLARRILQHPAITKSLKGFALAYLYVILPRFLSIISRAIKHKHRLQDVVQKMIKALRRGLLPNRFPAFVAKLIAGVFLLDPLVKKIAPKHSLFVASFVSGIVAFNRYKDGLKSHPRPNGLDTSDLTLTMLVRAVDVLVRIASRKMNVSQRSLEIADVGLFTLSCFAIMFAWFFYPDRLPPAYQKWITMAANMEDELVDALRYLRQGEIVYGKRGKHDDILANMCKKCGIDASQGRFSESIPLPCKLVHMGIDGCEKHACWRWYRGFVTALSIYVPINVAVAIVSGNWKKAWKHVAVSSARSSAFLATFIVLNWYGVCLVRTRIGPKLFPNATAQQLEDTYGPALGSALCGLSSLIEYPKRRGELALFVAPRALSIAIPQEAHATHKNVEGLVFAGAFAVLVAGVRQNRENVRGVFRRLMTAIF